MESKAIPTDILDSLMKLPFSAKSKSKLKKIYGTVRTDTQRKRQQGMNFDSGIQQNYHELRQYCLNNHCLFEDPEFPASDESLFKSGPSGRIVEWKRPHEICNGPKFIVEGISRFDINQGEIGDCWLLAAIANLTLDENLMEQVVPTHQTFDDNYAGIFHFRFWEFGEWVDVIIDDRLPTVNGKLKYLRSSAKNEFWSPLLEKAYAKLYGSYEALNGGITSNAMIDFTGGVAEVVELKHPPRNLLTIMMKSFDRGSFLACSIRSNPLRLEERCSNGLVRGHAYSITRIVNCNLNYHHRMSKIPLIRLRNPWGNEAEWNGPWSDGSSEWRQVSQEERTNLGLTFEHDGEFWMSYEDFVGNFSYLELININLKTLKESDIDIKHAWEVQKFKGSWTTGVTAGGSTNYPKTFWRNPKYILTLREEDDGDFDHRCTTIVSLLQRSRRSRHYCTAIGFSVFLVPANVDPQHLDQRFFRHTEEIPGLSEYSNSRQVTHRYELPPGTYCVIPSTLKPNKESDFLLRIFSEKRNPVIETTEALGFGHLTKEVMSNANIADIPTAPTIGNTAGGYASPQANMLIPSSQYHGMPMPSPVPSQTDSYSPSLGMPMPPAAHSSFSPMGMPPMPHPVASFEYPTPIGMPMPPQMDSYSSEIGIPNVSIPPQQNFAFSSVNMPMPQEWHSPDISSENYNSFPTVKTAKSGIQADSYSVQIGFLTDPDLNQNNFDDDLRKLFEDSAGRDMELDWKELQKILNNKFTTEFPFDGFSKSSCRSMIAIMDDDQSGTLSFEEFSHLWNVISMWKKTFLKHDKDHSGYLDGFEFRDAVNEVGYELTSKITYSLLTIYGNEARNVSFDDFILCLIKLNRTTQIFVEKDLIGRKECSFTFEEFVNASLCM